MTKGWRRGTGRNYQTLLELIALDTDECSVWPHGMVGKSKPYGQLYHEGKQRRAHVVACELVHGPRPSEEHEVAHACDNPPCVNPHHLRWATRLENVKDAKDRGRWPERRCKEGCTCGRHRRTDD